MQSSPGDPGSVIFGRKIRAFDVMTKPTALKPHQLLQVTVNSLPANGSTAIGGNRG